MVLGARCMTPPTWHKLDNLLAAKEVSLSGEGQVEDVSDVVVEHPACTSSTRSDYDQQCGGRGMRKTLISITSAQVYLISLLPVDPP